MHVVSNLAKSCLLATVIFWIIAGTDYMDMDMILVIFLSFIPIFFIATIVILGSIYVIFWLRVNENFSKRQVYKTFYPYYAIIAFGIAVFGIISSGFDIYIIAFFTSAFITTSQSWIWFAKEKQR